MMIKFRTEAKKGGDKWMQKAFDPKNKGKLHERLGISKDKKIPDRTLKAIEAAEIGSSAGGLKKVTAHDKKMAGLALRGRNETRMEGVMDRHPARLTSEFRPGERPINDREIEAEYADLVDPENDVKIKFNSSHGGSIEIVMPARERRNSELPAGYADADLLDEDWFSDFVVYKDGRIAFDEWLPEDVYLHLVGLIEAEPGYEKVSGNYNETRMTEKDIRRAIAQDGRPFELRKAYDQYELWLGNDRLEAGSLKDVYQTWIKNRFKRPREESRRTKRTVPTSFASRKDLVGRGIKHVRHEARRGEGEEAIFSPEDLKNKFPPSLLYDLKTKIERNANLTEGEYRDLKLLVTKKPSGWIDQVEKYPEDVFVRMPIEIKGWYIYPQALMKVLPQWGFGMIASEAIYEDQIVCAFYNKKTGGERQTKYKKGDMVFVKHDSAVTIEGNGIVEMGGHPKDFSLRVFLPRYTKLRVEGEADSYIMGAKTGAIKCKIMKVDRQRFIDLNKKMKDIDNNELDEFFGWIREETPEYTTVKNTIDLSIFPLYVTINLEDVVKSDYRHEARVDYTIIPSLQIRRFSGEGWKLLIDGQDATNGTNGFQPDKKDLGDIIEAVNNGDMEGMLSDGVGWEIQKGRKSRHEARNEVDEIAARELAIYTTNDGQLYRQQAQPIILNLAKKIIKGVYDPQLALKLWGYLAEAGAKGYVREFGSRDDKWFEMFPASTRRAAAEEIAEHYQEELDDKVAELRGESGHRESRISDDYRSLRKRERDLLRELEQIPEDERRKNPIYQKKVAEYHDLGRRIWDLRSGGNRWMDEGDALRSIGRGGNIDDPNYESRGDFRHHPRGMSDDELRQGPSDEDLNKIERGLKKKYNRNLDDLRSNREKYAKRDRRDRRKLERERKANLEKSVRQSQGWDESRRVYRRESVKPTVKIEDILEFVFKVTGLAFLEARIDRETQADMKWIGPMSSVEKTPWRKFITSDKRYTLYIHDGNYFNYILSAFGHTAEGESEQEFERDWKIIEEKSVDPRWDKSEIREPHDGAKIMKDGKAEKGDIEKGGKREKPKTRDDKTPEDK